MTFSYFSRQVCTRCKKEAFSLVEVMVTLLIVSIIIAISATAITKRHFTKSKAEGVVYTYNPTNNIKLPNNQNNFCYVSSGVPNALGGVTFNKSTECSRYEFTVPEGVTKVNLTLVAGGGGGGGAAGGRIETGKLETSNTSIEKDYIKDTLKSVTINQLNGNGYKAKPLPANICDGGYCSAGNGGDSSETLLNYTIPKERLGSNLALFYEEYTNFLYGKLRVTDYSVNIDKRSNNNGNNHWYNYYNQTKLEYNAVMEAENFDEYLHTAEGHEGETIKQDTTINTGTVLQGGLGGYIKNSYGKGQNGNSVKFICIGSASCTPVEAEKKDIGNTSQFGTGYSSVTYTLEAPGGVGGGGAGGTFARILGFNVAPGERYVIFVGHGGNGGRAGDNQNAGIGGTSTSIFRLNDDILTLQYLVVGGTGGMGGQIPNDIDRIGTFGVSAKHRPYLISGVNNLINNTIFDNKFIQGINGPFGDIRFEDDTQERSPVSINYSLYDANNNRQPYLTLNLNGCTNYNTNNEQASCAADGGNIWLGGFSNFYGDNDNKTMFVQFTGGNTPLQGSNVTISNNNVNNIYDGLYYRTMVNNIPAYVGGLGGFTGFGGKAGCGGFFRGNYGALLRDGNIYTNNANANIQAAVRTGLINKFIINNALYDVNKYYDNCRVDTPDGQSANFVMPDFTAKTFGQAGAGGGGGGWNMYLGAGKGGNGQDGYLMIDWVK